jgi:hypothetical protein
MSSGADRGLPCRIGSIYNWPIDDAAHRRGDGAVHRDRGGVASSSSASVYEAFAAAVAASSEPPRERTGSVVASVRQADATRGSLACLTFAISMPPISGSSARAAVGLGVSDDVDDATISMSGDSRFVVR